MRRKFYSILPNLLTQRSLLVAGLSALPLLYAVIFSYIHRQNFPRNEEVQQVIAFAVQLHDQGTLTLVPLFKPLNGYFFSIFPNALVMFSILVAKWNIDVELAILFLIAVCTYAMLLAFVYKSRRSTLYLAAFPLSMLVFSLHQDSAWVMGYYSALWLFPNFFFLLGLSLAFYRPNRWSSLLGAGLAAFAAMLSYIGGFLTFFLIGGFILITWKRNWRFLAAWAAITILGYLTTLIPEYLLGGNNAGALPPPPYDIPFYIFYFLTRLGSEFSSRLYLSGYVSTFTVSAAIGALGVILFITNTILLARSEYNRKSLMLWLAIAGYGLGIVALLTMRDSRNGNIFVTQVPWYDTGVNLFWIALVALVIQILTLETVPPRWVLPLRMGNTVGLIILAGFYVLQNHRVDETSMFGPNPEFWYTGTPATDHCARDYVQSMDATCLGEYTWEANQLASIRMAAYASLDPVNVLSGSYQSGDRVIVATETLWQAIHTRDWLLDGIPSDSVLYVIEEQDPDMHDMRHPPEHWISAGDSSDVAWPASEDDRGSVWVLRLNALPPTVSAARWIDRAGAPAPVEIPGRLSAYWTLTVYAPE